MHVLGLVFPLSGVCFCSNPGLFFLLRSVLSACVSSRGQTGRQEEALPGFVIQQIVYACVGKYLLKLSLIAKQGCDACCSRGLRVPFQSAAGRLTLKINSISPERSLSRGAERTCQAGLLELLG